jgi:hypothetical protein
MTTMTRHLTKRELLAATPVTVAPAARRYRQFPSVPHFVIANGCRGIALGLCFAALVLFTDAFGIATLIEAQPAPLTTAFLFVLVSSFKFVALTIAVAVGLAAHDK